MDLNYYLDLIALCNVSQKQRDAFFRFVFDVMTLASQNNCEEIKEHFFKDDTVLINGKNKFGIPLHDLIFQGSGEIANRIIPIVLKGFLTAYNLDGVQFGHISDDMPQLHPNAKLTTPRNARELWELYEKNHYQAFRSYHVLQKVYSNDCEKFISKILPSIELTKKAIGQFKRLAKNDKEKIISDLRILNDFVNTGWKKGTFPIDDFSAKTGVAASDESEKTKNDPKCRDQRLFHIPNIGSVYCFLHIKISNTYRIHFHPNSADNKVYIPYIGKHLKTSKYR